MPAAADLVTYLDPLLAGYTAGVNLFKGPPPEDPDVCICVQQYGGEAAEDRVMAPSLQAPGIEVAHVQITVRNPSQSAAEADALLVHGLLDNYGPGQLSGRTYFNIESIDGEPYSLGQDANLLWEIVANYRVQKGRG